MERFKEIFNCRRRLYREKLLVNVEQAPSPALEKNSRGRLFHIFSSTGVEQNGHESLASAGRDLIGFCPLAPPKGSGHKLLHLSECPCPVSITPEISGGVF
jgi:hypothetical protein